MKVVNHTDGDYRNPNPDPKNLEIISFEVLQFCNWLKSEGYEEKCRQHHNKAYSLADANTCISFQHPLMGWAHVSEYVRGKTTRVECILHPGLAGERTVHGTLASAVPQLAIIKDRTKGGNTSVISEKKKKKVWCGE